MHRESVCEGGTDGATALNPGATRRWREAGETLLRFRDGQRRNVSTPTPFLHTRHTAEASSVIL